MPLEDKIWIMGPTMAPNMRHLPLQDACWRKDIQLPARRMNSQKSRT